MIKSADGGVEDSIVELSEAWVGPYIGRVDSTATIARDQVSDNGTATHSEADCFERTVSGRENLFSWTGIGKRE